jgi:hypothetical protein
LLQHWPADRRKDYDTRGHRLASKAVRGLRFLIILTFLSLLKTSKMTSRSVRPRNQSRFRCACPSRRPDQAPHLFETVASRICDLPMGTRRRHQTLKKQTHQSNSNQSDFTLGILPRFEREPENSRSQKTWIARASESRHQSQTIGSLPLQRGLPCSLIQCIWNLIKLSACFPLIKRPLISARLHGHSAPSTAETRSSSLTRLEMPGVGEDRRFQMFTLLCDDCTV